MTNFPPGFIVVSDLRTEKVYAFADAGGTMTDQGTTTALHELDPATGETNGVVIALSASVPIEDNCSPSLASFAAGDAWWSAGRNFRTSPFRADRSPRWESRILSIRAAIPPSRSRASRNFLGMSFTSWPASGLTARIPTGAPRERGTHHGGQLPRPAKQDQADLLAGSQPLVFQHGQWLAWHSSEITGYADATWDQSDEFPPPPALAVTVTATLILAEDATTNGFGSFTQQENAGSTQVQVVASSNPSLVPTNHVTFFGGGFLGNSETGAFEFVVNPVPNSFGTATLTFLTTNSIGGRATNFLAVTVMPINNDPPQIVGVTNATLTRFVPPPHLAAQTVRLTNTFGVLDPDLTGVPPQFSFVTPDPVRLPLSSMSVVPDGTNFQFIIEVPAGQALNDLTAQLIVTDETGQFAAKSFYLYVLPTGIRPGGVVANTDYRVYAQGGLRDQGGSTSLSVTGMVGQVRQALLYVHSALAPTYPTLKGVNLGTPDGRRTLSAWQRIVVKRFGKATCCGSTSATW